MNIKALLCMVSAAGMCAATHAAFTLRWHSIDGGGSTFVSSSSCFRLSGTIGQPDASGITAVGPMAVRGGFWTDALVEAVQIGDVNCDGDINNFDIDPFVVAIVDPVGYSIAFPGCDIFRADVNRDGVIDNFDIDAFVRLVICE
ncbi:MAG: hypothetical protein JNG88_15760 [Phycisphaerales bacterium]|nr:hypothetical protein [Phycisphaerales bacterium]